MGISKRLRAAFACALLLLIPHAGLARDYKADIATLYSWTREQGKDGRVDQRAAIILGFSGAPPEGIAVTRKAYQDNETRFIYAFNLFIVNQAPILVMFKTTTTLSALWLLSLDGRILRAAEATKAGSGPVAVDRHPAYFVETIDYLLKERSHALAENLLLASVMTFPNFRENDVPEFPRFRIPPRAPMTCRGVTT